MAEQPGNRGRLILERVSRVIEAHPDQGSPTIRKRAGTSRQVGDAAIARLLAEGFLERTELNAEWHYRSVKPYRANVEAPRPAFEKVYSVRRGGTV